MHIAIIIVRRISEYSGDNWLYCNHHVVLKEGEQLTYDMVAKLTFGGWELHNVIVLPRS